MQNTTTPHNLYSFTRLFPQCSQMVHVREVNAAIAGHSKVTLFDGTSFNAYSVQVGGKSHRDSFEVSALLVTRKGTKDGYLDIIPIEKIKSVESRKVEMTDERMAEIKARRAERNRNR